MNHVLSALATASIWLRSNWSVHKIKQKKRQNSPEIKLQFIRFMRWLECVFVLMMAFDSHPNSQIRFNRTMKSNQLQINSSHALTLYRYKLFYAFNNLISKIPIGEKKVTEQRIVFVALPFQPVSFVNSVYCAYKFHFLLLLFFRFIQLQSNRKSMLLVIWLILCINWTGFFGFSFDDKKRRKQIYEVMTFHTSRMK